MNKIQKIILISASSLLLVLVLIIIIVNFTNKPEKAIINDIDKETEIEIETRLKTSQEVIREPVIIPTEFLSEDELIKRGLDPQTRAQIISHDPLIYKIIRNDEDIIEDISPWLY